MTPTPDISLELAGLGQLEELLPLVAAYHAFEEVDSSLAERRSSVGRLLQDKRLGEIWLVRALDGLIGYIAVCYSYSITYETSKPPYTFDDMADDAIRVLDGYGITKAHVAGMSLGGMIGQLAALKYPSRVSSFTAISTTPVGTDTSHLPQTTEAYMKQGAVAGEMDWSNRDQVIPFIVKDASMLAGTAYSHDERAARDLIERDFNRAANFKSVTNHFMLTGGEAWKGWLREMQPPLLVIHGTADPIFPVEHGAFLAETVPGAKLLRLEGGGHELNKGHWDKIIGRIVEHTEN